MELRHLRYFVAVAEEQNITRAAVRLNVSQPPLSRQIRDLENELGIALFHHGPKSVQLSEAGRVFLIEVQAVLKRVEVAIETAKSVAHGKQGEIHVGYAPSLTVELLPATLRLYHETNPGVRIRLHDLSSQEMLDNLREGKLNIALMIQTSPKGMVGLVFEELRRYAVCLAMHPSHALAHTRKVGLKQIVDERLITYTISDYPEYHLWLTGLFSKSNRIPQCAEEHDSSTSLIAAVEAGRGVALVQQGFECLAGPRLVIRPIAPAPPPFIVGMVYSQLPLSAATRDFISACRHTESR